LSRITVAEDLCLLATSPPDIKIVYIGLFYSGIAIGMSSLRWVVFISTLILSHYLHIMSAVISSNPGNISLKRNKLQRGDLKN